VPAIGNWCTEVRLPAVNHDWLCVSMWRNAIQMYIDIGLISFICTYSVANNDHCNSYHLSWHTVYCMTHCVLYCWLYHMVWCNSTRQNSTVVLCYMVRQLPANQDWLAGAKLQWIRSWLPQCFKLHLAAVVSLWTLSYTYTVRQKIAPFYVCNNFVKPHSILIIFNKQVLT